MDYTKWKSVAVRKDKYDIIKALCDKKYKSKKFSIIKYGDLGAKYLANYYREHFILSTSNIELSTYFNDLCKHVENQNNQNKTNNNMINEENTLKDENKEIIILNDQNDISINNNIENNEKIN